MTQLGVPYVWGGRSPGVGLDCSGLTMLAFKSIGVQLGADTYSQINNGTPIPKAQAKRGDLVFSNGVGHVALYLGDGTMIEAQTTGVPVKISPVRDSDGYRRVAENGGPDPTAPFNPPALMGPGSPPNTGSGGTSGTSGSTRNSVGSGQEPIARNLFTYQFVYGQFQNQISEMFGEYPETAAKAYINDEPLIQMVAAVSKAGLRHFASAPNGDFVAYYPDYWGLDGKNAVWHLEDIEIKDLVINYCDDALVTHCYVAGSPTDMATDFQQPDGWLNTEGVVSVEDNWLFQRLIQVSPGAPEAITGEEMMKRYGVRPFTAEMAAIRSGKMELLIAMQLFMQKWAEQYATEVELTFMPEIFPGMRLDLSGHGVEVYLSQVTHTFDFEQGFSTSVVLMAPHASTVADRIQSVEPVEDTSGWGGTSASGSLPSQAGGA
jgi:hypothetical protein